MNFLTILITATLTGTLVWSLFALFRFFTKRVFSQTWHYYTLLVSLFFFLGGAALLAPAVAFSHNWISQSSLFLPQKENIQWTAPVLITDMDQPLSDEIQAKEETAKDSNGFSLDIDWIKNHINLDKAAKIMFIFWLAGFCVHLAKNICQYIHFRKYAILTGQIYWEYNCPVKIIKCPHITVPMIIGILKPVILVPEKQFNQEAFDIIISHELMHYKRGDLYIKFLFLLVNSVHWFNPMIYIIGKDMDNLCENSCDEMLVKHMGKAERRYYGETILSVLEDGVIQRKALSVGLFNNKKNIKRRLTYMMKYNGVKKYVTGLSIAMTIIVTGFGGVMAYAANAGETAKATQEKAGYAIELSPSSMEPDYDDMDIETAAAIGMNVFAQDFGMDLTGKKVSMFYTNMAELHRRDSLGYPDPGPNQWSGVVLLDDDFVANFTVNTDTGLLDGGKIFHRTRTGPMTYMISEEIPSHMASDINHIIELAKQETGKYSFFDQTALEIDYEVMEMLDNELVRVTLDIEPYEYDLRVTMSNKNLTACLEYNMETKELLTVVFTKNIEV